MPELCRNTLILVPLNVTPFLRGLPARFERRFENAGTDVILVGPFGGAGFTDGIDTPALWKRIPPHFGGNVWTNGIFDIAPTAAH